MKDPGRGSGKLVGVAAASAALLAVGYVGRSWLRYGKAEAEKTRPDPLLDRFMPRYEIREFHETRVAAPAEVAFTVARELDMQRSGVVRAIFKGRELFMGAASSNSRRPQPFLSEVLALGWRILHEEPGRKLVVGAVTRPWEANVTFRGLEPENFAGFQEPGYTKIIWTLEAEPAGGGTSSFRTETRAVTTDAAARRRFRRYWAMVSPGVTLIRHEMLRQIRGEAAKRFNAAARPV
jgi:hypothetical protein